MNKIREYTRLVVALVIVGVFVAMVWTLGNASGAWDVYRAQQETRAAEARADALEAEAAAIDARREFWATGALVFASVKDSLLVTFAFLCNSVLLAVLVVVVVWSATRRNEKPEPAEVRRDLS